MIHNVKDLRTLKNGEVVSPLQNFNLIQFFKDVYSNKNKISKEKLDLYKIWVSLINLPSNYIENKILKNYIYPNTVSNKSIPDLGNSKLEPVGKKRKSEYTSPSSKTKRSKDNDFIGFETPSSPVTDSEEIPSLIRDEKFIDEKFSEYTPQKRVLRSNKKEIIGSSFFIMKKPKIKWLPY